MAPSKQKTKLVVNLAAQGKGKLLKNWHHYKKWKCFVFLMKDAEEWTNLRSVVEKMFVRTRCSALEHDNKHLERVSRVSTCP